MNFHHPAKNRAAAIIMCVAPGPRALIIDWLDAAPLGQLADRIIAFLRERREDHQALITWRKRDRHALREFWARAPADALGVKQEFEKALAQNGKPPK